MPAPPSDLYLAELAGRYLDHYPADAHRYIWNWLFLDGYLDGLLPSQADTLRERVAAAVENSTNPNAAIERQLDAAAD